MTDVPSYPVMMPAAYIPVAAPAFGAVGRAGTTVIARTPLPVTDAMSGAVRYFTGIAWLVPVVGANDVAILGQQFNGRPVALRRVTVSGTASTAAMIDILLQRSPNGGGLGTPQPVTRHDAGDTNPTGTLFAYTANRTTNGNGISSSRPVLRTGKLTFATPTTPGSLIEWRFVADRAPMLKSLDEWFAINLAAQSLPAGASLSIDVEWANPACPLWCSPATARRPLPCRCSPKSRGKGPRRALPTSRIWGPTGVG